MSKHKPIIGLAGGIGSGKSFVGHLMGELGCLVIGSDQLVRKAYQRQDVKEALRHWWGEEAFLPSGEVNRDAIAGKVFNNASDRNRLEKLIHPLVGQRREQIMERHHDDPKVAAFVWDVPLLFETGLNRKCDAIIFVDSPLEERLRRIQSQRGWNLAELNRREKTQWPLDKKRGMSDYIISNFTNTGELRDQIRNVLSLILSNKHD